MNDLKIFLAQTVEDLRSFVARPTTTCRNILARKNIITKYHVLFVILSQTYFLFLPSYLILFNIIGILIFFMIVGMIYYYCQEALLILEEETGTQFEDDRFFYMIGYCYGLASTVGLILNLLTNILTLTFSEFLIVGVFIGALLNIPITLLVIVYCIKVTEAVAPGSNPVQQFIELTSKSFIVTCKEGLGFKALGDILIDWRELG